MITPPKTSFGVILQSGSAPAQPTAAPAPKQQPYNEAYLDILLGVLRNAQPGQDVDSMPVQTSPPMTLKQLEATCLVMQCAAF